MSVEKLVEHTGEAIETTVREFLENPWDFLYESDIRARLFSRLFDLVREDTDGVSVSIGEQRQITTSVVKTEYPSRHRFDVAIIDTDSDVYEEWATKMYPYEHPDPALLPWQLPVCVAVEIKDHVTGFSVPGQFQSMMDDIGKIQGFAGQSGGAMAGLSILFLQSPGTLRNLQPTCLDRSWDEGVLPRLEVGRVLGCVVCPGKKDDVPSQSIGRLFYRWFPLFFERYNGRQPRNLQHL